MRERLEARRRAESTTVEHPRWGQAAVRDQKPLNEKLLAKCLRGMSPSEWYRILNGKVFFWTNRERMERFLCAGAYKNRFHEMLVIDTASLRFGALMRTSALAKLTIRRTINVAETRLPGAANSLHESRALLKVHALLASSAPNPKQFARNLSLATAIGDAVDSDATVRGVPILPSNTTSIFTANVQRTDFVPASSRMVLTPTSTPLRSREDRCWRIDVAQNKQHSHPSK